MTKKAHDFLRLLQWILPALGTLYAALAAIWNWPLSEPIVATVGAVVTFIGVMLQYDSKAFFEDKDIIESESNSYNKTLCL